MRYRGGDTGGGEGEGVGSVSGSLDCSQRRWRRRRGQLRGRVRGVCFGERGWRVGRENKLQGMNDGRREAWVGIR